MVPDGIVPNRADEADGHLQPGGRDRLVRALPSVAVGERVRRHAFPVAGGERGSTYCFHAPPSVIRCNFRADRISLMPMVTAMRGMVCV